MRHHDEGSVVLRQRLLEHVLGRHVKVVGRFVEHQKVDGVQHQLAEREASALAARKHAHLLFDVVARKHEVAQKLARVLANLVRSRIFNGLEYRLGAVEHLSLVLGVVAELNLMAPLNASVVGKSLSQNLDQRRLALAVLTHKGNLLAAHKLQIESTQHVLGPVVLVNALQAGHDFARMRCGRKLKPHLPRVLVVDFDDLDFVELFDERLRERSFASLGPEPFHQLLRVLDFFVLVGLGLALLIADFVAKRQVPEVRNIVVVALTEHNFEGAVGRVVQEGPVVRNQNDSLVALGQKFFEPQNRFDVEVVRRFVQEQDVVVLQQNFGEFHAHLPSARKRIQRLVKVGRFESEAQEHALKICLVGVAADVLVALLSVVKALE